jgi:localization factor PodJL
MGAARPGAFSQIKKIGRSKLGAKVGSAQTEGGSALSALMTPRNLKLGGLVAALGVASFIGVQTLAKKDAPVDQNEFSVASNAQLDGPNDPRLSDPRFQGPEGEILPPREGKMPVSLTADGRPILPPKTDEETIGEYSDNRKMALVEGGESALMQAVNAGNPVAQLQLGLSKIETGELEGGVELIRAAANQEQPAALYRLAKLYETGQGVGQDAKTARQLTERAARGGNRIAMHDLALYHAEGRGGVEVDMPTAAKWFEKAAERGVVDSQFNLGVLFESGQGLPQDMESALVWYSVAGAQGDQMAAGRVGVLRKTLPEDQVTRADNRIASFAPSRIDEEANGIFNNVPWAKPSQVADNSLAKTQVVQTQTLLNELGYAVGAADGAIGPKTKNAILNFQKNNNLSETGTVNAELIERLQMAAGA